MKSNIVSEKTRLSPWERTSFLHDNRDGVWYNGEKGGEAGVEERLIYEILSVVEEIPVGKVASYGQISRLVGREKNARLVGKVLGGAQRYGSYPCHRVVNHAGRTAPGWAEQRSLLEEEGVRFRENGCVDMVRFRWEAE